MYCIIILRWNVFLSLLFLSISTFSKETMTNSTQICDCDPWHCKANRPFVRTHRSLISGKQKMLNHFSKIFNGFHTRSFRDSFRLDPCQKWWNFYCYCCFNLWGFHGKFYFGLDNAQIFLLSVKLSRISFQRIEL